MGAGVHLISYREGHMNRLNRIALKLLVGALAFGALTPGNRAPAADHGDAPNIAGDQACDIADVYAFLDPNDNSQVVIAMTFRGFIVPGDAVNFTAFDHNALYRFNIAQDKDATPDTAIDVTFSPRTAANQPQTATI